MIFAVAMIVSIPTSFAEIEHQIIGGTLYYFESDVDSNSLIIIFDATEDGKITITLPNDLINVEAPEVSDLEIALAEQRGIDVEEPEAPDFEIRIDGGRIEFNQIETQFDRTFIIPFTRGNEEIEIIGTVVKSYYEEVDKEPVRAAIGIIGFNEPDTILKNSAPVFEGENPADGEKDRMIAELQAENQQLREDLTSFDEKLESMNQILMEQVQVLAAMAIQIQNITNTVANFFTFDVYV